MNKQREKIVVAMSGGVDSSLNVALMAELLDRPVETFSIGIKDDPANEFIHARQVADHFCTNHHEAVIDDDDFITFLSQMAYLQDEPVADPVCVPIYYISKLARESGTPVIQVGEPEHWRRSNSGTATDYRWPL